MKLCGNPHSMKSHATLIKIFLQRKAIFMDKTGIKEVKKVLDKKNLKISRMRTYYVDDQKNILSEKNVLLDMLDDEEKFKYIDIFKTILSGKFGKNLYNAEYSTEAETDIENHPEHDTLMHLKESLLEDEDWVTKYVTRIINNYDNPGRYLIVLGCGVYDVPQKASDGAVLEDSYDVYQFMMTAICPVELCREGLCYSDKSDEFKVFMKDWSVQKPETGMLFPAFNERCEDIHNILVYTKSVNERHDEFAEKILGVILSKTEDAYKDIYQRLLEETFDKDCNYDTVTAVTDTLNSWAEDAASRDAEFVLDRHTLENAMRNNGAEDEAIEKFNEIFDEVMEEEKYIPADAVLDSGSVKVKSDDMQLSIKNSSSEMFSTKVIDGHEYLLVPITNNLTVNGVCVREKLKE